MFFGNNPDTAEDPVVAVVPLASRGRLFAQRVPELDRVTDEGWRFDVVIQGAEETPFFLD